MEVLTARQLIALRYIAEYTDRNGTPPTLREIGLHMGIRSTNGVNDHMRALERKGMLVRPELKARAIVLTTLGRAQLGQEGGAEMVASRAVVDLRAAVLLAAKALRNVGRTEDARAVLDVAGLEG